MVIQFSKESIQMVKNLEGKSTEREKLFQLLSNSQSVFRYLSDENVFGIKDKIKQTLGKPMEGILEPKVQAQKNQVQDACYTLISSF